MSYAKLNQDRQFVRNGMPISTKELSIGSTIGWSYEIQCEYGKRYTLFLYFDGQRYQVKCVFPEVAGKFTNIEAHHLFPDGRLCLDPSSQGAPDIQYAYTKSVVWANGFSVFQAMGKFPFSINNKT